MLTRRTALAGLGAAGLSLTLPGRALGQTADASPWRAGPDLPLRVQEIYPAVLEGVLYVAGGLSPDVGRGRIGISDRVFSLAPGADRWREQARLPVPLHHPNLVGLEGLVYAVGGFTAQTGGMWAMSNGVRVFDPGRNQWRLVARCASAPRRSPACSPSACRVPGNAAAPRAQDARSG